MYDQIFYSGPAIGSFFSIFQIMIKSPKKRLKFNTFPPYQIPPGPPYFSEQSYGSMYKAYTGATGDVPYVGKANFWFKLLIQDGDYIKVS